MKFIIAQIIGTISYSLLATSYFKKSKKKILFIQIIANLGFTFHYALLEAVTGTICNFINLFALILIYLFADDEKKKKILVLILIPLLTVMSFLSFENIYSLFPVIASLLTFNSFLSKDENKIRFIGIISALCWLVYAIIHTSYSAIVFEILTAITTSIAYIKNKKIDTKK